MPEKTTQKGRLLLIETPLGEDKLLVRSFSGSEGISQLFHYHLDLLSEDHAIDPAKLIGQGVTVRLQLKEKGAYRDFHGVVSRFSVGERDHRFTHYQAELVPWLWLLTQTADCRIFQDVSVPDVLDKVFKEYGFQDVRKDLSRTYTKWDYCVQYRETDYNFLARLMEQEGICYFFEHKVGKHVLVLADNGGAHKPCPGQAKARYEPSGGAGEKGEDTVGDWQLTQSLRPGKYTLRDYHFEKPDSTLEVRQPSAVKVGGNDRWEVYDYPGDYALRFNKPAERLGDLQPEGEKLVKLRMQEEEAPQQVAGGASSCRAFTAGYAFDLTNHPGLAGAYVLGSVQYSATQSPDYYSESVSSQPYGNSFTCLPAKVPFRPARSTPKPVIHGLQSAVVVGVKGKEIDVDKYGRVKVQFHWDREGKKDEKSSCWVRVAQPVAGKRWGTSFWPRIGQEVLVAFLEGDPDQPVIVGSLYNAEQMPPYLGDGLDSKHKNDPNVSGIKTNSTLGGQGFNELRFDDTKGKEQVFIHAERNMDTRVKNDSLERVFGNRHVITGYEKDGKKGGDRRELIYQDKHLHVMRHRMEHVEGNVQLLVGKGDASDGGNLDVSIEKKKTETIGGDSDLHVTKDLNEKVDGTVSLTTGKDLQQKIGMNHGMEAGQAIHLKAGMTVVIEAGVQLTLKVGGNFVDISPAGVSIQGTMVMINSGGAAGAGAGAKPTAPKDAKEAKPTKPDLADDSKSGSKSAPG